MRFTRGFTTRLAVVIVAASGVAVLAFFIPKSFATIPTDNLRFYFDAANIDGTGTQSGDIGARTDTKWKNYQPGVTNTGTLVNFNFNTTNSGWDGAGTTADPYCLKFDGTDDGVTLAANIATPKSFSIWFNPHTFVTGNAILLYGDAGGMYVQVMAAGYLAVRYNAGTVQYTGIQLNAWQHLVISNNGSTTTFYLDGVQFASVSTTADTNTTAHLIGDYSTYEFDGAIANVRIYSDTLTAAEVTNMYGEEHERFYAPPASAPQIDRLVPAAGTGGTTVTIYGSNFTGTTGVTFGMVAGTSVTVVDDYKLTVVAPITSAGYKDVKVTTSSGNDTSAGAFLSTDSPTDNVILWYDAANIDGNGTKGHGTSRTAWNSITAGPAASLVGVTQPGSGTSGWDGDGTASDEYRLQLDGSDDGVWVGNTPAPKSFSVWFNPDSFTANGFIFYHDGGNSYALINTAGYLTVRYNGCTIMYTGVALNTWQHLAIADDGTTVRFYLDGILFGSATIAADTGNTALSIGDYSTSEFDGAIANFRMYSDTLTEAEILMIYGEERYRLFDTLTYVAQINRVSPAVGTGGTTVTILGSRLTTTTSVTFGGSAGTSLTIVDDYKLTVVAPANMTPGYVAVQVNTTEGATSVSGFLYTDSPTDNVIVWYDAANIDGIGTKGDGATNTVWRSMMAAQAGAVLSFTHPTDGTSGWDGNGTASDEYRLQFDGTSDVVNTGTIPTAPKSYSFWFNPDSIGSNQYVMYHDSGNTYAYIYTNFLTARYNGSSFVYSGIGTSKWQHLVIANDGSTTRYYLDGVKFGSVATSADANLTALYLGAYSTTLFDGGIANFRMYSDTLTESEIFTIYNEEHERLFDAPASAPVTDRLLPAAGTGGTMVTLYGSNLLSTTGVTFDGVSGTSVSILDDGRLTVVAPTNMTPGYVDVVLTNAAGTFTSTGAFLYTDTPIDNLIAWFDAANIDGNGSKGDGATDTIWKSLTGSIVGGLVGVTQPTDGSSGWDGNGTSSDEYCLHFDGTDDGVSMGTIAAARSYSVWFNPDNFSSAGFLMGRGTSALASFNVYGYLNVTYNSVTKSTGLAVDEWQHLVIANNGSTTRYYLDGILFGTGASTAEASASNFWIGDYYTNSSEYDGSIANVRLYSDSLSENEVQSIFREERVRFFDGPASAPQTNRLIPAAGTGGTTVTLYGWNFTDTSGVTFDGVAGTSLSVLDDGRLTVVAPAHVGDEYVDVVVTTSAGTFTSTGAFLYTDTPTDHLLLWLDPGNIDGNGSKGDSATNTTWKSTADGSQGSLVNMSTSEWQGNGTTADPYRVHLDGTDDGITVGTPQLSRLSYSMWFKPESLTVDKYYLMFSDSSITATIEAEGYMNTRYDNGTQIGTGVGSGSWQHLVVVNDGANTRFYLDGVQFGSASQSADITTGYFSIGWGGWSFDGFIASTRAYSDALTESEIYSIYEEERRLFFDPPSAPHIDRIVPATGSSGTTVTLHGWDLSGVTGVTFGCAAATNVTVVSDSAVTATIPLRGAGFVDVSATAAAGTVTSSGSFLYTATPTSGLITWLDAANIDANGTKGHGSTNTVWLSMVTGPGASVIAAQPTDGSSGWDGDGTTNDAYRLQLDGSDDGAPVGYIPSPQAFSLWFNADVVDAMGYLFFHDTGATYAYVGSDGNLYVKYNGGTERSTAISAGTWYHLVVSNNGTTTTFYLNNSITELAADTNAADDGNTPLYVGKYSTTPFNGALTAVRAYSVGLSAAEVAAIYSEGKNAGESINNCTPNPALASVSHSPDQLDAGTDITFTANWEDMDSAGVKLYVCKTDGGTSAGCGAGGSWCTNSNDYESSKPITCSATPTDEDAGPQSYYAYVCDADDYCSNTLSDTFSVFGWLSGFGYRKRIVIDNTHVDGNLSNFPVFVKFTADTDIGTNAQSDGDDIRFTTQTGGLLPFEEDRFWVSSGSGTGMYWVKVPTVLTSTGTILYVYYGSGAAEDGQNISGTWDSTYRGVWHFGTGASLSGTDSTSYNNDTTPTAEPTADSGIIGTALSMNLSGELHNADANSFPEGTSDREISGWIKTGYTTNRDMPIIHYGTYGAGQLNVHLLVGTTTQNTYSDCSAFNYDESTCTTTSGCSGVYSDYCSGNTGCETYGESDCYTDPMYYGSCSWNHIYQNSCVGSYVTGSVNYDVGMGNGWNAAEIIYVNANVLTDTWHQVVGTYNSSTSQFEIYVDGAYATGGLPANAPNTGDGPFSIGNTQDSSTYANYSGLMDEVRMSATLRGAAWHEFEYYNITEGDNELTFNAEEEPSSEGEGPAKHNFFFFF
ncbi:MAG: DUF2341 domain-containing protein [Candidatus Peribacteraceae bacterium]